MDLYFWWTKDLNCFGKTHICPQIINYPLCSSTMTAAWKKKTLKPALFLHLVREKKKKKSVFVLVKESQKSTAHQNWGLFCPTYVPVSPERKTSSSLFLLNNLGDSSSKQHSWAGSLRWYAGSHLTTGASNEWPAAQRSERLRKAEGRWILPAHRSHLDSVLRWVDVWMLQGDEGRSRTKHKGTKQISVKDVKSFSE